MDLRAKSVVETKATNFALLCASLLLTPGPEKMFSFLGAQISMSYLPGKPVIFDSFFVATINPHSSFSWSEIVI